MPSRRNALYVVGTIALGSSGCLARTAADDGSETMVAVSDGNEEIEAVTYEQVASTGEIDENEYGDGYLVPVEFTDEGVDSFAEALETAGAFETPQAVEMRLYLDRELISEASLGAGLAEAVEEGEFDGKFLAVVDDRDTAERLRTKIEEQT